jgi:hypothetical protein
MHKSILSWINKLESEAPSKETDQNNKTVLAHSSCFLAHKQLYLRSGDVLLNI